MSGRQISVHRIKRLAGIRECKGPAEGGPAPQVLLKPQAAPAEPSAPAPIAVVDVAAQLEKLAASQTQKLNWKVSIVDLLKLLGLDSSFAARKELAAELGCPSEPDLADSSLAKNIFGLKGEYFQAIGGEERQ